MQYSWSDMASLVPGATNTYVSFSISSLAAAEKIYVRMRAGTGVRDREMGQSRACQWGISTTVRARFRLLLTVPAWSGPPHA